MNKKTTILLAAIIAITAGSFWVREKLFSPIIGLKQSADSVLEEFKKDVSVPGPLRLTRDAPQSLLTQAGVFNWTNNQRAAFALVPFRLSPKLNEAALLKVQDMFARQYFEHISPTGGNISTLLNGVGYSFIAIGENLALGNYENDQALVQAWMDSPGHRANILNRKFTEVGIAVAQGNFEGRQTWLAVQAFALPASACPEPDVGFKAEIDSLEARIAELKVRADVILTELENMRPKRGPEYNQKVDEYNAVVAQINNLVAQLKTVVSQYNTQVSSFNVCIGQ